MNESIAKKLHLLSTKNKDLLKLVDTAGCYYCCKHFPPSTIKEWIGAGECALCPLCGIDSVLPDPTDETLKAMYDRWFVPRQPVK
jgi:hypothetical protein